MNFVVILGLFFLGSPWAFLPLNQTPFMAVQRSTFNPSGKTGNEDLLL